MCASLKLQGATFNENRLQLSNMRLVQARPRILPSTLDFVSCEPRALSHGHPRRNRKCHTGDERQ